MHQTAQLQIVQAIEGAASVAAALAWFRRSSASRRSSDHQELIMANGAVHRAETLQAKSCL